MVRMRPSIVIMAWLVLRGTPRRVPFRTPQRSAGFLPVGKNGVPRIMRGTLFSVLAADNLRRAAHQCHPEGGKMAEEPRIRFGSEAAVGQLAER